MTPAPELKADGRHQAGASTGGVELLNVGKYFDTRQGRVQALEDITLTVRPRMFVCLIGPSGCGKSTILNLIADLLKPSTGDISVNGKTTEQARRNRSIGLVFQDPVLLPWRTVLENIKVPLEVLGIPAEAAHETATELVSLVGLEGFEHRFPHELSGGMRQRVGIARALSFDPPILLMDEPFGALDAITRDKMSLELLRIWEHEQKTVIFVTHSITEAAFLSDRVVVMTPRPGRISAVLENPLPRPRNLQMRDDPVFLRISRELREMLEGA